jgi:hypothetical protein
MNQEERQVSDKQQIKMVEKYQCPGCVKGSDVKCGAFAIEQMDNGGFKCSGHAAGTIAMSPSGVNKIVLGLPPIFGSLAPNDRHVMVLIDQKAGQQYVKPNDEANIPVWKMRYDGDTLVRIARPLSGRFTTLVVDGDIDVPHAMDVSKL